MIVLRAIGKVSSRRPVNLFFMEIIISLLFFSISGAVILKVFAAADLKARCGAVAENVMLSAQSAAEAYSVSGDACETLRLVFGAECEPAADGSYDILLDSECRAVASEGEIALSACEIRTDTEAGTLSELTLEFNGSTGAVYTLVCSAYIPSGGGAYE